MSDIGLAEIPVDEEERPLPPPPAPVKNALLDGPILPTLCSLAWPNIMAFSAGTCVVIAETSYIGRLGVESLAAIALVFPCVVSRFDWVVRKRVWMARASTRLTSASR